MDPDSLGFSFRSPCAAAQLGTSGELENKNATEDQRYEFLNEAFFKIYF